jgi:hypothetical protein
MEKGITTGGEDTVRIYKVSLAGAQDVSSEDSLATTSA